AEGKRDAKPASMGPLQLRSGKASPHTPFLAGMHGFNGAAPIKERKAPFSSLASPPLPASMGPLQLRSGKSAAGAVHDWRRQASMGPLQLRSGKCVGHPAHGCITS